LVSTLINAKIYVTWSAAVFESAMSLYLKELANANLITAKSALLS